MNILHFLLGQLKTQNKDDLKSEHPVTKYEYMTEQNLQDDVILKLLTLFERANHYVKEGEWYESDRSELYALKDKFLTKFYKNKPEGVEIELMYVPYMKYCQETKDKAGQLMRADGNKQSFEYYLAQVKPYSEDIEIPEKATIEMLITYIGRTWCFHIPQRLVSDWKLVISQLKRKVWMNGKDFHSQQFMLIKAEAEHLLTLI